MLAMRRYAESSRHFWTDIIKRVKNQHASVIEPLLQFQKTELKKYKDQRAVFESCQSKYDSHLSKYMSHSKNKEPSSLREDAFQLNEVRIAYIKACFALCCTMPVVQAKLDICLVRTLAQPWVLKPKEFVTADPIMQRIAVEMFRLKSWAKTMQKSYVPLTKNMLQAAKDVEQATIDRSKPSRDLNSYTAQNSSFSHFVPLPLEKSSRLNEKHGWLFIKTPGIKGARNVWIKRWVFVKSGMFGWLNISPNGTFVQESDKIGVLLCHTNPVATEDRRFCFEIKMQGASALLQAETLDEMTSWLQVFEDAKHMAIASDKTTAISYAFKRIPPMITEFACTANTSTDSDLTQERGIFESPINNNISLSLAKNIDTKDLQALIRSGQSLTPSHGTDNNKNPGLGSFGSALTPSPLLNIAMPTSMSQEAILSHSLLSSSVIPTAVTANYWGSVNWGIYQKQDKPEGVEEESVDHSRQPSIVQTSLDKYPSYYPLELKLQDAQMRAIFQQEVGDTLNDKVVLVSRCIYKPNLSQQIPARFYITPTHFYMYSHFLGMVSIYSRSLKEAISVEGRTSINHDLMYIITNEGTTSCKIFLDSSRVLQKRLQFLIDNANSPNPLGLEQIIGQLKLFGTEKHATKSTCNETICDRGASMESVDQEPISESERPNIERKFFQLYLNNYIGGSDTDKLRADISLALPYDSDNNSAISKLKPLGRKSSFFKDPDSTDMSKLMSHLSVEKEFDIPAKALFHIMFGETSPVFTYSDSGFIQREGIQLLPWKLINSQIMEREILFKTIDSKMFFDAEKDSAMFVQRLEKIEDNCCYIVYERRAVWKLPQSGSFYTTFRYVITRHSRNSCKLSIWSSVEWINWTILKHVTENMIQKVLNSEAQTIVKRALDARRKLGPKGSTTTAIRLFGKLGASIRHEGHISKPGVTDNEGIDLKTMTYRGENDVFVIPTRVFNRKIAEVLASWALSVLSSTCMVVTKVVKLVGNAIMSNKIILLGLFVSCLINLLLAGRSTQGYWMARHAEEFARDFGILPTTSHTVMQRSILLQDVDKLIANGSAFSVEKELSTTLGNETSTSLCYDKFASTVLLPTDNESANKRFEPHRFTFDMLDPDVASVDLMKHSFMGLKSVALGDNWMLGENPLFTLRNRVYNMRAKLGIQRNALLVELRMINRIETELLHSEWQTWLFDEVSMCSRIVQDVTFFKDENGVYAHPYDAEFNAILNSSDDVRVVLEAGKKINGDSNTIMPNDRKLHAQDRRSYEREQEAAQRNHDFLRAIWKVPREMRQFFSNYCLSCAKELGSVVNQSRHDGNELLS